MRHRSVRTRIGSILLTGAMLLSLLPTAAWATEVTETGSGETAEWAELAPAEKQETPELMDLTPAEKQETQEPTESQSGDNSIPLTPITEEDPEDETGTTTTTEETGQDDDITTEQGLIDAISGAQARDKITLAGDITLNSQLTIDNGKEIVLDLYGHTLNAGSHTISVTGESSLTIETSSGEGKITAEKQIEVDSASLTLNSGEIEITGTSDKSYGIYVSNNGFVTVNNGTINSSYAALAGNNTTGDMNFEVNGGQLSAKNGPAIYMPG